MDCFNDCGKPAVSKYCSKKCQLARQRKEYIEKWTLGLETGNQNNGLKVSNHVRAYLFEKYNSKCARCGWNQINESTGSVPLEVEHIDGNSDNSVEQNLILLCPNCHSLTPTFRNLNKGKSKRIRKK